MAEFSAGRAATSAFFSVASVIFYLPGPLTGNLSDRFGPRVVVSAGAIAMGVGLMLTAFIDQLSLGYLTYGIVVGSGAACAYVPTLANIGGWFIRQRNVAFGIAAAGTGCGILLVPPFATVLIELYGWRIADIVLGIGSSLLLAISALVVAPAQPSAHQVVSHCLYRHTLRSFEFGLIYVSWLLATTALFVPFLFLPEFALRRGVDQLAASALLSMIGGASVLSRLGMGLLSGRMGTLLLFKLAVLTMAASYVLWLILPDYFWLVIFAATLGLAYGLRIALLPSVLIEFFGLSNLGTLLGIILTGSGIASVLGPIIAGAAVDYTESFQWGIFFALVAGTLGLLAIAPLKLDARDAE